MKNLKTVILLWLDLWFEKNSRSKISTWELQGSYLLISVFTSAGGLKWHILICRAWAQTPLQLLYNRTLLLHNRPLNLTQPAVLHIYPKCLILERLLKSLISNNFIRIRNTKIEKKTPWFSFCFTTAVFDIFRDFVKQSTFSVVWICVD